MLTALLVQYTAEKILYFKRKNWLEIANSLVKLRQLANGIVYVRKKITNRV